MKIKPEQFYISFLFLFLMIYILIPILLFLFFFWQVLVVSTGYLGLNRGEKEKKNKWWKHLTWTPDSALSISRGNFVHSLLQIKSWSSVYNIPQRSQSSSNTGSQVSFLACKLWQKAAITICIWILEMCYVNAKYCSYAQQPILKQYAKMPSKI